MALVLAIDDILVGPRQGRGQTKKALRKMIICRWRIRLVLLMGLLVACSKPTEQQSVGPKTMRDIDARYTSSEQDWSRFLLCWNDRLTQGTRERPTSPQLLSLLAKNREQLVPPSSKVYAGRTLALEQLERRLNVGPLPTSFRHFAQVSGGGWVASRGIDAPSMESNLSPVEKVGLFMEVDPLNWGMWHKAAPSAEPKSVEVPADAYYRYDHDQDRFRWFYLDKLIKVGELEQGTVLLMNPLEVTADGEWEAWLLSTQVGAFRYRSFAELMQSVAYQELQDSSARNFTPQELARACGNHLKTAATLETK